MNQKEPNKKVMMIFIDWEVGCPADIFSPMAVETTRNAMENDGNRYFKETRNPRNFLLVSSDARLVGTYRSRRRVGLIRTEGYLDTACEAVATQEGMIGRSDCWTNSPNHVIVSVGCLLYCKYLLCLWCGSTCGWCCGEPCPRNVLCTVDVTPPSRHK